MFRCSGVQVLWFVCSGFLGIRVFGFFWELTVGVNFGFGRSNTIRNATWGSILIASRKMLKTAEKLMFGK